MILNCCPNFEKCCEHYLDVCQRSTSSAFDCSDCNSYQCYFLGFQAGKNNVIKKVSEVIQLFERLNGEAYEEDNTN